MSEKEETEEDKLKEMAECIAMIVKELFKKSIDISFVMSATIHLQTLKAQPLPEFEDGGICGKDKNEYVLNLNIKEKDLK